MQQHSNQNNTTEDVLVGQYIAMWNEPDAARRLAIAGDIFTDRAVYRDPVMSGEGATGISTMIASAQTQFAGLAFQLRGTPEATGDCIRFSWSLGPADGPSVVAGTDFAQLHGSRFTSVTGFIDQAPGDPPPAG